MSHEHQQELVGILVSEFDRLNCVPSRFYYSLGHGYLLGDRSVESVPKAENIVYGPRDHLVLCRHVTSCHIALVPALHTLTS